MAYFGLEIKDSQESTRAQMSNATEGISLRPAKPTCGYPQVKIYGSTQETGRHTKITQAKFNILK